MGPPLSAEARGDLRAGILFPPMLFPGKETEFPGRSSLCRNPSLVAGAGHIDSVTIGGASADISKTIDVRTSETVHVGGWSVSSAGLASGLCVLVDGRRATFEGTYGVDRPDVATALGKPEDRGAGFDVALHLPKGRHVITIGPVQADGTPTPIAQQITVHVR